MSQLHDLSKPFKGAYISEKPGGHGASYVEHNFVTERLLLHLGAYSFEVVQVIRGDYLRGDKVSPNVVQAVVCRLSCEIDGRPVVIEEVGDVEFPANWNTEGARIKVAISDAIKRCAMRIGLGLHLWSGEGYFLDAALDKRESPEEDDDPRRSR